MRPAVRPLVAGVTHQERGRKLPIANPPTPRLLVALEFDAELAARSQVNLAHSRNVQVIHGNGAATSFDGADVIYINAGATRPAEAWLDGLSEAGRLILPLTTDASVSPKMDGAIDFAMMGRRGAARRGI
jgi:protein-L-isoaspartate(D-aspartate) O-methyltransferase